MRRLSAGTVDYTKAPPKAVDCSINATVQCCCSKTSAHSKKNFGSKIPPKRGLVDCNTTDEFETVMAEVTGKWDEQFTFYFNQCIADDIQNGMAPGIR